MNPDVSERAFEEAIECALLAWGPDECAETGGASIVREPRADYAGGPGSYRRRHSKDYDRARCLLPRDVLDFVYATQPKQWARLQEHHGGEVKERFLGRLANEIERRGALDVLRKGLRDSGCRFNLAYFQPASGLNEDLQRLYDANVFSVVRQLHYSQRNEKSLDLALFLNGIPIFTAELKNPFNAQDVQLAIKQYRTDRDPREPLFAFGRCLAHFAVDPDLVFVTTHIEGPQTKFLPFNQGKNGGAGNPPVPPTRTGYATGYLWDGVWSRDSILNLIQHFIHVVENPDGGGRGEKRRLIFPRYHQLDAVRRLVADARERGPGQRYLIQHSAGSGKSNSIAWLAHQLSVLHDTSDRRVFDSIVIVSDRKVLDRQLQTTVRQFQQTPGVVENIDKTSRQLKEALESGKTIIVSTLQKFPFITEQIDSLPGKRFALIVDEAHSSQAGDRAKGIKEVLGSGPDELRDEQEPEPEDVQDRVVAEARKRGPQPNMSTFAFTATPKPKTLELFGTRRPDGGFDPFSLYSMCQAIEEKFILDVLENYTTYKVYWSLLKKIEDDPRYERAKAAYLLRSFVDHHEYATRKKVEVMLGHFTARAAHRIRGRAKAMIVARSRAQAVAYKLAVDEHIKEQRLPFKALVAFSDSVKLDGKTYTESGMNGFSERQTAEAFARPEYRLLIVANKFQTGFDQPLLHTMYVDKKLGGVGAVQTLSRLNRIHPDKEETMVLDFANEAEAIQAAFQPYYGKTSLTAATDPNLLYDLQRELFDCQVCTEDEVNAFARLYFVPKTTQDRLYAALNPAVARYEELADEQQVHFRGKLVDYVRLYAFLSQVITFSDPDLEKLYVYARLLRRHLPTEREALPVEIQQKIDMESYRIQETRSGALPLARGNGIVEPIGAKDTRPRSPEAVEPLSQIIRELNERFGTDFSEEDRVFIEELEQRLSADEALTAAIRANTPENARLTFDHVVTDRLQDMVDTNFKFYKRVTDDPAFGEFFREWLFERVRGVQAAGESAAPDEGEAGPSAYDAVADLVGSVEGGDPGRSTRGAQQIAAELKKRRAARSRRR